MADEFYPDWTSPPAIEEPVGAREHLIYLHQLSRLSKTVEVLWLSGSNPGTPGGSNKKKRHGRSEHAQSCIMVTTVKNASFWLCLERLLCLCYGVLIVISSFCWLLWLQHLTGAAHQEVFNYRGPFDIDTPSRKLVRRCTERFPVRFICRSPYTSILSTSKIRLPSAICLGAFCLYPSPDHHHVIRWK